MMLIPLTTALLSPCAHAAEARQELTLNGTWEIAFDHENQGRGLGWDRSEHFPRDLARRITVPSCWELIEKDYEGVAFYRRESQVPAGWAGRAVRIHFGAVNFRSEVWLNDTAVGVHEGGFGPFEFRVDDLLKPGGPNTLILRVVGPILLQNKEVDGVGRMETPQWRGAITGGIWQPVKLLATGPIYVKDVFIEPKIADDTAAFHLELDHTGDHPATARLEVAIRSGDARVATVREPIDLQPGVSRHTWTLAVPDAVHWSPGNPHLYRAEVSVTCDDAPSDTWTTRFGMREFTIRDKQFLLNGQPMYLKAAFFEGLYPVGLAYPDSREMAEREIQLAKDTGLNMIRPWTEVHTPEERDAFAALEEFVNGGGTAVYLQAAGREPPWGNPQDASRLLPVDLRLKRAIGLWTGISHVVKDHPAFAGLPVNCIMGPVYENVWAEGTLLDAEGESIVGVIGYDYCPDFGLEKRHYYGPGDTWGGSDLAIIAVGAGRCIVSQLRLVENLGRDPVADRILYNLIEIAATH